MSGLDPEERTLYAFRRNVVIAASAGTGKTHRLTALYVLLSLGLTSMGQVSPAIAHAPIPPSRIVATTFSRAAANEIRSRVEAALRLVASGGPLPFSDIIGDRVASLGVDVGRLDLPKRAAQALASWHGARIDTLHGVAGTIVKEHALALGVSPRARVEEEDEGRALIASAVDETLGKAFAEGGESESVARALVAAGGGVVAAREHLATLFARMDEDGVEPEDLLTTDHLAEARAMREELASIARACALGGGKRSAPLGAALVRALESGPPLSLDGEGQRALSELFSLRRTSDDKSSLPERELHAFKDALGKSNKERTRHLVRLLEEAPELAARERAMLELCRRAREAIASERRQRGVLSFGDLLRLARDGLRDDPELSRIVRSEIDVLMVDEFQDTSSVQRDLVYLLRERIDLPREVGVAPSASGLTGSGLFVVGDRKQSIYGFRGADVAVFSRVATELAGRAAASALGLGDAHVSTAPSADFFALRESRRSGPSIVSFVNAFSVSDFAADRSAAEAQRDFEVAYGPAEQLVSVRDDLDDRVVFVRDDGDPPPASEPLLSGGDPALREAFVAAAFAERASGALGFELRDIAILARRRSTIPLVELALGRLGIPYVVAGRALYEASEVRDLAALVRLVLDPRDRHALATVLRGPLVGLSDAALLALASDRGGLARDTLAREGPKLDPRAFVEESGRLRDFRERFLAMREPLLRLAPGEALRSALSAFDLDRIIAALPRAAARLGNVDRVIGIARERGGTLLGFSRWLDRQIADETDEAEAAVFSPDDDAVRLTTIHASKGLDFRAVILLDLDAAPRPVSIPIGYDRDEEGRPRFVVLHKGDRGVQVASRIWSEAAENRKARELAERKRITYVAVTRAKELLALVGRPGTAKSGSAFATLLRARELGSLPDLVEASAAEILEDAFGRPRGAAAHATDLSEESTRAIAAVPRSLGPVHVDRLPIATTPLGVFRGCARRFRLRFLLGLEEPLESGQLDLFDTVPLRLDERVEPGDPEDVISDPRTLGRAAHRVLELWPRALLGVETESSDVARALVLEGLADEEAGRLAPHLARILSGPYARSIAALDSVVHREDELVWRAVGAPALILRGTLDLYVERPDGLVDVVDYKLSRPQKDIERYQFQLRSYALALARNLPGRRVRAGILFLEGGEEPVWLAGHGADGSLSDAEHDTFAMELASLAARFTEARTRGVYPPIPLEGCRALHCGFVTACHKPEARRERLRASPRRRAGH